MRLVVVKTGDTLPAVKARYGDFDLMFVRAMSELGVAPAVIHAHQGDPLPAPDAVDAAIITGSPASVSERAPWADALAAWSRDVVAAERRVLGVCYGHQLLAHALGGVVGANPRGYEVGTIEVELGDDGLADPLLGAVARGERRVPFHSTHMDAVLEPPPGARVLASTAQTPVQAFAYGDRAWGVQFHPEFTESIMRLYIDGRADAIRADAERRGLDPEAELARVQASVIATPHGPFLIRRFIEEARALRVARVDRA